MFVKKLTNIWVTSILVDFVDPKDGGTDVLHLAEKIEDIKSIGGSPKSVSILEVDTDGIVLGSGVVVQSIA